MSTHVFEGPPDSDDDGRRVILLDVQRDVLCGALSGSAGQTYCLKDVVQRVEAFARHQSLVRWFSTSADVSSNKRVVVSSACVLELAPVLREIHDIVRCSDEVELWIQCDGSAEALAAAKAAFRGSRSDDVRYHHRVVATERKGPGASRKNDASSSADARSLCRAMAMSVGPERERYRTCAFHDDDLLMMLYENAPRLCPNIDVRRLNRFFIDASILAGTSSSVSSSSGSPCIDASYEIKQRALLHMLPEPCARAERTTWTRSIALALTSQRSSIARHFKHPNDWYERFATAPRSASDGYDKAFLAAWSLGG